MADDKKARELLEKVKKRGVMACVVVCSVLVQLPLP